MNTNVVSLFKLRYITNGECLDTCVASHVLLGELIELWLYRTGSSRLKFQAQEAEIARGALEHLYFL